ncbi:MAG: hypothetical protein KC731_11660 [Myxococcales bacterium]|nr:hypothetical protein [Myxococcales bacterium]
MRESGQDIDNGTIFGVGLIGALLIATAVIGVQALFESFDRADRERKATRAVELVDYESQQADKLTRYRWVDEKNGVVAIPIERAMDLLSERGLPAVAAPAEAKSADGESVEGETASEGEAPTPKEPPPAG